MAPRRSYGSGRVYVRRDSAGRETFYGTWWANGRWVNRRLGVKRPRGSREGLTGAQAEAELRRLMGEAKPSVAQGERPATAYRAEGLGDHRARPQAGLPVVRGLVAGRRVHGPSSWGTRPRAWEATGGRN
jgi:hypothetical protein